MFVLCFALTAGVASPVVTVCAEELQESVTTEVDAGAEQMEESATMEESAVYGSVNGTGSE